MATGKTAAWTIWTFVNRVMSLLFNSLSRFANRFLPRSHHLQVSWLQSQSAVILQPQKRASIPTTFSPSICHAIMGADTMILIFFLILILNWLFHSPCSPSSSGPLVSLHFLQEEWYHLHIWGFWYFSCLSWFQFVTHPAWHFSCCPQHVG